MNLLSKIRDAMFGAKPALKNRPGGLAWITDTEHGLYGRIVTTVRADDRQHWSIDPPQPCRLTSGPYATEEGNLVGAGDAVTLLGIHDDYLEPLRNPGENERDESLTWKPVPTLIPLRVKGEVH